MALVSGVWYIARGTSAASQWSQASGQRWTVSSAVSGTISPDAALFGVYIRTAQSASLTINAPVNTAVAIDGHMLRFRLKDNGTSRAITWNAAFRAIGVTLPTATVVSKTTYVTCLWNAADAVWDVISVQTEA
jgi:hypothetical protein